MKYKIVEVEWYDAYSPSLKGEGYWGSKEDTEEDEEGVCYTVGYLISNKDGWLNVAQSDANFAGEDMVGGSFRIPNKWVKKIRILK